LLLAGDQERREGAVEVESSNAIVAPASAVASFAFVALTPPPGAPAGDYIEALAINDVGQVLVSAIDPAGGISDVDANDLYNLYFQKYRALPAFPGALTETSLENGINDSGKMVGQYTPPGNYFLQAGTLERGTFAAVKGFGGNYNVAIAISNNGMVTGSAGTAMEGYGFIDASGKYSYFSAANPTKYFTTGEGINDAGVVVGVDGLLTGGGLASFVYQDGKATPLAMPGETQTIATGINDWGEIVGYATKDFVHYTGFIDVGGVFTAVGAPGATSTLIQGINDLGEIVGEYYDAKGEHAFVGSPTLTRAHTFAGAMAAFAPAAAAQASPASTPRADPPLLLAPRTAHFA
jgi:hypothetical protein